ncbi:kinase/pyrophosphorylase [Thiotrichales bacterium 19S9-12]|nr:kinase/pyrophosphorylase [Thiotrichales bacterium 19S9-11]MCF6812477.1 kinase/pyrophosphorylase [Thiotrichales bacterium 19S9-12]
MKRDVLLVSDGTGITANSLAQSLLSQFDQIEFNVSNYPFINNEKKLNNVITEIESRFAQTGNQPIVITTIVCPNTLAKIQNTNSVVLDFIQTFIGPLEQTLGVQSSHTIGKAYGMHDYEKYKKRIDALNFSLNTDDGACPNHYDQSEIILVGVSRCGKTPTSLYLSLHHSIFVSNYPLTEEDIESFTLPKPLLKYKHKIFGLTIDLERLVAIRTERKPNSRYASIKQCQAEIKAVEKLYRQYKIPYLNSTALSVEELATKIMAKRG